MLENFWLNMPFSTAWGPGDGISFISSITMQNLFTLFWTYVAGLKQLLKRWGPTPGDRANISRLVGNDFYTVVQ